MKKVLSLLASIGLIATATVSVVACTTEVNNNANVSLNDVKDWFTKAQPEIRMGTDGVEHGTEGKTMLVAIGGRHNSDTLSYLATLTQLVNKSSITSNANNLLEEDNINSFEKTLGSYQISSSVYSSKESWQKPLRTMINAVQSAPDWEVDDNQSSVIARKYFYHDLAKPIIEMSFHTILVDNVENFWKTNLAKGIVNEIIGQQLKDFLQFIATDPDAPSDSSIEELVNDQEKFDKFIKDKSKNLLNTLQSDNSKGPWFLVVRSGKIVSIKTGFRNYYEYNSEYKGLEERRKNSIRIDTNLTAKTWEEFSQSIANSLKSGISWLRTNFLNIAKEVGSNDLINQNRPNNPNNAWTSKISGSSNVTDLDKPRGEEPDDNEEETLSYHFNFLD